jgi:dTMP kinase
MASQGMFIVFEGGEGSGKDTHIDLLREAFGTQDDIVYTREPGGTTIGEAIRSILMDTQHDHMSVETELLLFLASRAQLLDEVVRPALQSGTHVISNRFALSTIAYQIFRKERHEYRGFLDMVSAQLMSDVAPYYVLLDVDPEVGLARARGRDEASTRFDLEAVETHEKVRRGYHDAVQAFPHVIVDANRPLPEVHTDVRAHVKELLTV